MILWERQLTLFKRKLLEQVILLSSAGFMPRRLQLFQVFGIGQQINMRNGTTNTIERELDGIESENLQTLGCLQTESANEVSRISSLDTNETPEGIHHRLDKQIPGFFDSRQSGSLDFQVHKLYWNAKDCVHGSYFLLCIHKNKHCSSRWKVMMDLIIKLQFSFYKLISKAKNKIESIPTGGLEIVSVPSTGAEVSANSAFNKTSRKRIGFTRKDLNQALRK